MFCEYCGCEIDDDSNTCPKCGNILAEADNDDVSFRLFEAAKTNDVETLRKLIESGVDIETKDSNGLTPLMWAAKENSINSTKKLIAMGANIEARDKKGLTPLIWSAKESSNDVIKILITVGASIEGKDKSGKTALFFVAEENLTTAEQILIDAGANIMAEDFYGFTALMRAAENDSVDAAKALLNADTNNRLAIKSLKKAAYCNSLGIANFLISLCEDKLKEAGWVMLMSMTRGIVRNTSNFFYSARAIRRLVNADVDINKKDKKGWTALMYIASLKSPRRKPKPTYSDHLLYSIFGSRESNDYPVDVAELLITAGADIDAKSDSDVTALMIATQNNSIDIVELLICSGADVNARDKNGRTALMIATYKGRENIAKVLIKSGANLNEKDKNGRTALMYAVNTTYAKKADYETHEHVKNIVKKLLNAGADVNIQDNNGLTALMFAAETRHSAIARMLIKSGADLEAKANDGSTALIIAEGNHEKGYQSRSIVRLLRHAGAKSSGYLPDVEFKINGKIVSTEEFGKKLVEVKFARRKWIYSDGHEENNIWRAYNFYDPDNLYANIRSSKYKYWRETGLVKLIISIDLESTSTIKNIILKKEEQNVASRSLSKPKTILNNLTDEQYKALLESFGLKESAENSNTTNNTIQDNEKNSEATDVSPEEDIRSLFRFAKSNDTQKLQEILQSGIDINAKDDDGWTALMYAASKKAVGTSKILIDAGADINAKDNCGWTALMNAVDKNSIDIVKLLINSGAELEIRNNEEKTAIMLAKGSEADKIIALLKDAGAEPQSLISTTLPHEQKKEVEALLKEDIINDVSADFKNVSKNAGAVISDPVEVDMKKCDIPLVFEIHKLAKTRNCKEVLSLIQPNAYIDSEDSFGWTALMYAVRDNAVDIAKILIDAGSNIHKTTKAGKTVLKIASDNKAKDVERLLRDAGAN